MSVENRDRVQALIRAEFPGDTVDDVIGRLLDDHWRAGSLADMERFRHADPDGYQAYLRDAQAMERASAVDLERKTP